MDLTELKRGDRAVVLQTASADDLKRKLTSLGIYAGAKLQVLRVSPLKHTYLVQAGTARVALGRAAAQGVKVWRI